MTMPVEDVTEAMMQASYAAVALHQRLPLEQIAQGATQRHFPMRDHATPEWFAAAAGRSSSLDEIAPELQIDTSSGDLDWDLIRMYAPELQDLGAAAPGESASTEPSHPSPPEIPSRDREIRIDLLAELRGVDE